MNRNGGAAIIINSCICIRIALQPTAAPIQQEHSHKSYFCCCWLIISVVCLPPTTNIVTSSPWTGKSSQPAIVASSSMGRYGTGNSAIIIHITRAKRKRSKICAVHTKFVGEILCHTREDRYAPTYSRITIGMVICNVMPTHQLSCALIH